MITGAEDILRAGFLFSGIDIFTPAFPSIESNIILYMEWRCDIFSIICR